MSVKKKITDIEYSFDRIRCSLLFNPRDLQYTLYIHLDDKYKIAIGGIKAIKEILDTIIDDSRLMREITQWKE